MSFYLTVTPSQIKKMYHKHYIGKEKEFIELLLYIKENNNLDRVLQAIKQLTSVRLGYVNTERILFICNQTTNEEINIYNDDETMNQSKNNMRAYATMFNQIDEGVTNNG
mgnify:FL=1